MYLPPRGKPDFPAAPEPTEGQNFTVDKDLRSWLETNSDVVTVIKKTGRGRTYRRAISAKRRADRVREHHR